MSSGMSPAGPAKDIVLAAAPTISNTSPASTASATTPAVPLKRKQPGSGKGKGKANQDDDDDEGGSEDEDGRKRKRNRMALSCRECKRRKVKCDRSMPSCGPCTKRGQASACTWDVFSTEGFLPPSIARTADVVALADRLAHVEAFLLTIPPNIAIFKPIVPAPIATPGGMSEVDDKEVFLLPKVEPAESYSDTEDAVVDLENGVFGRGAGAADSLAKLRRGDRTRSNSVAGGGTSRFGGVRNMEFTKALTCIVTMDRGPGVAAYSKVHLDVDFDASPEEVEFARLEAVRKICRVLLPRPAVVHLVQLYFSRISWLFHHVHAPSFLAELDAYHAMCDAGRADEVDISWIALLLMILCVALDGTHSSRSPLSLDPTVASNPLATLTDEQIHALPESFFQASQRALALAEWESIPRIRSIQTIVLFTQYLQLCAANRGQPSQLVTWLAGAIRIAQVLGLHLLGSNPETMPPDDPAYPPGKNSLKRESAKRLWGVLVFQDWMGASPKNRCYLISPLHFDTDDPSNLNDVDLSALDWKVIPAPQSVLTDSTPDRVRIAMSRQVRAMFDAVVLAKDRSYETVMELDRGFRAILDSLPARWTMEMSPDEELQPMLRYQRHFALEGLHNRIFRLHRPYCYRGYRQPKYRFSTDACVKSSQVVIISTHKIAEATKDVWWTYSHCMGAALVLFNDLFYAIDQDMSAVEIDAKRDTLHLVLEIFSRSSSITSVSLQNVVTQGAKILTGLFRAEESRRAGRAARTLVTSLGGVADDEKEGDVETFAEVLQRLYRSLNSHTERHRGTPPPTRNILTAATSRLASFVQYPTATAQHMETVASPWPFPSLPVDTTDDLSLQFYEDLGMLESSLPDQSDFWTDPSFGAFAMPPAVEPGSQNWELDHRAQAEGAAAANKISTLLEQLGGGW